MNRAGWIKTRAIPVFSQCLYVYFDNKEVRERKKELAQRSNWENLPNPSMNIGSLLFIVIQKKKQEIEYEMRKKVRG